MIKLDRLILDAEDVFTACISRIRDQGLRQRMVDVTDDIVDASEEFDNAATHNRLHLIARQAMVGGLVTRAEMEAMPVMIERALCRMYKLRPPEE